VISKRLFLTLLLAALLLGLGAGFLLASRARSRHARPPATHGGPAPTDPRPDGWTVADKPPTVQEIQEELNALGYSQAVEESTGSKGVTLHDPAQSQPGWNLVLPAHEPLAVILDMDGNVLHEWRFPYRDVPGARNSQLGNWRRVRALDDGGLLGIFEGFGLIRIDRDSRLVWYQPGNFHHELDVADDGRIYALARHFALWPRFHPEAPTVEDFVVELAPDGRELGRFSLIAAFENSAHAPRLYDTKRGGDIFHTNALRLFDGSLERLSPLFGKGKALISIRHLDAIAILDLESEKIVWTQSGLWHLQHDPTLLENGHLLVFDNQTTPERSSVVEVDPFTQEVVWAFRGSSENDFFSRVCGTCQRLPNGNTLITESTRGRALEVTPAGEIVWRYESAYHVGENPADVAVLFDVVRLPGEHPLDWLEPAVREPGR